MKRVVIALVVAIPVLLFVFRNAVLHQGASSGQNVLMSIALAFRADPNAVSSNGDTPLLAAAQKRNAAGVKQLIAAGADVNYANRTTGITPLMIAATHGDEPMVDALLAAGASLSARDKEDRTAYWYAFQNHESAIARKVHYVQVVDVKLPERGLPSYAQTGTAGGAPAERAAGGGRLGGGPPGIVPSEQERPLEITDTKGWTRVGPNQYVKRVSKEESAELEKERRRQIEEDKKKGQ